MVVAWNVAILNTILICIDVIDDLREREDGSGRALAGFIESLVHIPKLWS